LHFAHGDVRVTGPQNWFITNSVELHRLLDDSPGSEGLRAFINIFTWPYYFCTQVRDKNPLGGAVMFNSSSNPSHHLYPQQIFSLIPTCC
jgi:hypothetical protein